MDIWEDFRRSPYAEYDGIPTTDEVTVRSKVRQWEQVTSGKEYMFYAVCLEEIMIGYVDFHRTDRGYECGYCFHSDYHGRGYAKESMQALMRFLANGADMEFTAGTALENRPSVKLLYSLGFEKIGEERVTFYKDEQGKDIYFDGGIFRYIQKRK